jgi:hypothetical protein
MFLTVRKEVSERHGRGDTRLTEFASNSTRSDQQDFGVRQTAHELRAKNCLGMSVTTIFALSIHVLGVGQQENKKLVEERPCESVVKESRILGHATVTRILIVTSPPRFIEQGS